MNSKQEEEMKTFIESQKAIGLNMAVAMYMVDAMLCFEKMKHIEVTQIMMEIALKSLSGISPDVKNYTVNSLKGRFFTGYNLLAYFYVSTAIAKPDFLSRLQIPYEQEYEIALNFYNLINRK
jgi:hypothetical protein